MCVQLIMVCHPHAAGQMLLPALHMGFIECHPHAAEHVRQAAFYTPEACLVCLVCVSTGSWGLQTAWGG